jgi:hypothetical protein
LEYSFYNWFIKPKTTPDPAAMPRVVSSKTLKAKAKEKKHDTGAVVGPVVVVLATAASGTARGQDARQLDPCVSAPPKP